jgi:hypothetical protein
MARACFTCRYLSRVPFLRPLVRRHLDRSYARAHRTLVRP